MFDTLIKGGTVIDGSGGPGRVADVAVRGGKIVAVEPRIDAEAAEVVDAAGLMVTPGFVDVHTHYDGQATWDDTLLPSSAHGVTTIVMGNCGIGFAPVRKGSEDWLIALTEGVEDIPGSVLHEGIRWSWETFPQYLDALAARRFSVDVATHVPHSALRAFVMGQRTADDEAATPEDIATMAALTREGIEAGALGFGTSRVAMHYGSDGRPLPGTSANERELLALAEAMRAGGGGVFQLAPSGAGGVTGDAISTMGSRADTRPLEDEIAMMRRLTDATGQKITFSFAQNRGLGEDGFNRALDMLSEIYAADEPIAPQFSAKPTGTLSTLDGFHAFQAKPTYLALAHLPLAERVARLRDPAIKAAILAEDDVAPKTHLMMDKFPAVIRASLGDIFPLDNGIDYEPETSRSMLAQARRAGREPIEYLYDYMLEQDGAAMIVAFATNYLDGDLRVTERMLREPRVLLGLGDGGAHVRAIVDASQPSFLLAYWGRDRKRGPTLPVETLIRKQTLEPAAFYGLDDRGRIAVGTRADINIIDFDNLRLGRPYLVGDLPAGGRRFMQDVDGYVMTMVAGEVTRRHGRDTGARPGRLVRGRQMN